MSSIDRTIITLNDSTAAAPWVSLRVDARCQIVLTVVYLCFMLSVPLVSLEQLVWYAAYPILWSTLCGTSYSTVFRRSLIVLPFIAFIGIFNPIFDTAPAMMVFGLTITRGWITFLSIIIRGLLSVQAVIILVINVGFMPMCHAMGHLGLPTFLETQLLLLYRYMIVLLEEVSTMQRARQARGAGRKLGLRMWGTMIGQLFVRTVDRAECIHRAMVSRGFTGKMRYLHGHDAIAWRDVAITAAWIAVFAAMRFVNIPLLLHFQ